MLRRQRYNLFFNYCAELENFIQQGYEGIVYANHDTEIIEASEKEVRIPLSTYRKMELHLELSQLKGFLQRERAEMVEQNAINATIG